MRVLILEDDDGKFAVVQEELARFFDDDGASLTRAAHFGIASKYIYEQKFDLLILDLMMPMRPNEPAVDISEDVISLIELSDRNRGAALIALSGFGDLVAEQRARFTDAGIILVHYDAQQETWRKRISGALDRVGRHVGYDFVIICALDKERNALHRSNATIKDLQNIRGLDCLRLDIGELKGVCVKPPRMGLVEASIITTRAIERFSPKIVAMSGICAGFSQRSPLGTLLIADLCWEYQAGKWASDGFKMEPYQVALELSARTALSQFVHQLGKGLELKTDLLHDAVVFSDLLLGPMATGSSVIASGERLSQVEEQHRKIMGLDMEMYGVYKAASLSASPPVFFGAKTVVDFADESKGDTCRALIIDPG